MYKLFLELCSVEPILYLSALIFKGQLMSASIKSNISLHRGERSLAKSLDRQIKPVTSQ